VQKVGSSLTLSRRETKIGSSLTQSRHGKRRGSNPSFFLLHNISEVVRQLQDYWIGAVIFPLLEKKAIIFAGNRKKEIKNKKSPR
jgi:hypothetical protein